MEKKQKKMSKEINLKGKKGITLIALVITIIILLILAGVAIATLTGDNGLLQKTTSSKEKNEEAEIEEQIKLAYTEWQTAKYTGETKNAQEYMEDGLRVTLKDDNLEVTEENEGIYVITTGGKDYTFTVSLGKIESDIAVTKIKKSTEKADSYVNYFADIDKDGEVDGIIFVDLLTGSVRDVQQYGNSNGTYILPPNLTRSNVNTYYISQDSYTWSGITNPVISPLSTNKEKRFYIMQLNNFTTSAYTDENDSSKSYPAYSSYYWYKNAIGKMNPLITSNDFGDGKENTRIMIEKWNAAGEEKPTVIPYTDSAQDKQDIWKHIQTKYNEGWFIPSKSEWAAFANEIGGNNPITASNYNSRYGLSNGEWSSSQHSARYAWIAYFKMGRMDCDNTNYNIYTVRLATTF